MSWKWATPLLTSILFFFIYSCMLKFKNLDWMINKLSPWCCWLMDVQYMYLIHGPFSHPRIIHSAIQFIKSIMLYRYVILLKSNVGSRRDMFNGAYEWKPYFTCDWGHQVPFEVWTILNKNVHPNGFRVYNNIFARLKSQWPRPLESQVSHALGRLGRAESILTQHPTTISKLLSYLWMTLKWMDLENPCKSCMLY
jgi:hypothetical protein